MLIIESGISVEKKCSESYEKNISLSTEIKKPGKSFVTVLCVVSCTVKLAINSWRTYLQFALLLIALRSRILELTTLVRLQLFTVENVKKKVRRYFHMPYLSSNAPRNISFTIYRFLYMCTTKIYLPPRLSLYYG